MTDAATVTAEPAAEITVSRTGSKMVDTIAVALVITGETAVGGQPTVGSGCKTGGTVPRTRQGLGEWAAFSFRGAKVGLPTLDQGLPGFWACQGIRCETTIVFIL